MACLTNVHCIECGETKCEILSFPSNVCQDCRTKIASKERLNYLAKLQDMTTEERLKVIEAQLYDLDLPRRLRVLEIGNARFCCDEEELEEPLNPHLELEG